MMQQQKRGRWRLRKGKGQSLTGSFSSVSCFCFIRMYKVPSGFLSSRLSSLGDLSLPFVLQLHFPLIHNSSIFPDPFATRNSKIR